MANEKTDTSNTQYPPVVTVLGHVDHGKTSLLDAIRATNIVDREHGGITQRIGASTVEVTHDGKKRRITFIDTPGHEAFSKMRSRGAQAADIGLLIVSSVDGVMPQTKESIKLLQDSGLPFIVVLTKADVIEKSVEKTKQQLLRENVLLEGLGGDVPFIEVSSKTGKNIKELLELIALVFDLYTSSHPDAEQSTRSHTGKLKAIVIESNMDQKSGPEATVVIKNGTLSVRDELTVLPTNEKETTVENARARTLIDTLGKQVQQAQVGEAVEILGFEKVPAVGSMIVLKNDLSLEEKPVQALAIEPEKQPAVIPSGMPTFFSKKEAHMLSLILVADNQGSLEAIVNSLPENVHMVLQKTGEISPADVLLGKSTGSIVLGFNVRIRPDVQLAASQEKVPMKNYRIIYELLDEVADVLEGKALALEEKIFGKAKILAKFPFEKTFVCGSTVLEGRVAKGDKVRLMRGEEVIGESTIQSIRQGKNQTSKVEKGQECGLILSPFLDFTIGDMLICHG
jgi:translation initiation factor IF-2